MNDTPRPNPTYEALEVLKSDIVREVPDPRAALDTIAEQLGNGSVWAGPQARDFSADIDDYQTRLQDRADDVVDDVQETLNATPSTLPPVGAV